MDGRPGVILLTFPVTYWDAQMRDPDARPVFTARQMRYARIAKREAYTPQFVVGGRFAFSDPARLNGALAAGQADRAPPDTVAEMARDQVAPLRAGALRSIMPQFAVDYDAYPTMHSGFDLGFLLNPEQGANGRGAGSLMWDGVSNTYFWIDPSRDRTGVVLMQFAPFADLAALALVSAAERGTYATM